jgi:glutamine amidotransferase
MLAIIDYQMGNLRSVQKAFERTGHAATITSDPEQVRQADKVVLPGVGAFEDAIAELRRRALVDPILESIHRGRPFLGLFLGLQLLVDVGQENGTQQGLGVLRGECVRFRLPSEYKVPHMGWNAAVPRRRPPIFEGLAREPQFYFVHSYYVAPADGDVVATETDYGGNFCSMIWRDNVFATQFHPEKSQSEGLQLLKNFAEL